jgi:N-acyl-D-aspartate/D-glutamate deacylase
MPDLVIKGGRVFDGLGNAPQTQDLRLRDGKIVAMGRGLSSGGEEEVDASGFWVLPGFLDIHTHYDLEVEFNPGLHESVRHGVTTVVMGHCSLSVTVGKAEDLAHMFRRVESLPEPLVNRWLGQAVSWDTPEAYLDHLASLPLGPNVVPMLGHSALRAWVMGLERSLSKARPTAEELASMDALARRCLNAGCRGISVDRVPWHMMTGPYRGRTLPSQHASWTEIRMLARACRDFDAIFQATPNPREPLSFLRLLGLGLPSTAGPCA